MGVEGIELWSFRVPWPPQAISRTREISGRIKSHLVLTLNSQSARVLAHVQSEEKILMPADVQKGGSGDGTASIMTMSERVAGYKEISCRYNAEPSIGLAQRLLTPSFLSLPQCPLCVSIHPKCVPDTGRYLGRLEQTEFKSRLLRTFSLQATSCLKLKKVQNSFNLLIKMTPSFCLLKGSGN